MEQKKDVGKVDWPVLESILYGMTKALDYLGEQGQILIDKMGDEILTFLIEKGHVEDSDDPQVLIGRVANFFSERGFHGRIESRVEGDPPQYFVYEYFDLSIYDAIKTLRDKECFLYSCPMCLTGAAILRQRTGLRMRLGAEVIDEGPRRVVVKHKVLPVETFSEEKSKEVSDKMSKA